MGRSRIFTGTVGLVAGATLLATAVAVASSGSDLDFVEPEAHGEFQPAGEYSAQGDSLLGWKIHNVDPHDFVPVRDTNTWERGATGNCLRGSNFWYAPVSLPEGSEVFSVVASLNDSTDSGQIDLNLRRRTFGTPSVQLLFSGGTGGPETPGRGTLSLDNNELDNVISKATDTFFVSAVFSSATPALELCNVQILYAPPPAEGLEFHPVTPCAIFDTRPGEGGIARRLANQEEIVVDTIMSDYSGQGGFAGSCGVPNAVGSGFLADPEVQTVAVRVNLVALSPTGNGNLRMWKDGAVAPSGGVLVYSSGLNNANELPVEVKEGFFNFVGTSSNGGEIRIQVNGPETHVRAVVTGYYTMVDSRW